MPNIKDVAQIAGVSVSTVSKALNNASDINDDTRNRVLRIAADIGYKNGRLPMSDAREIKTVGIICPEIISNYYAQILSTLEDNISKDGCSVSIAFTNFRYENEISALKAFLKQNVSGIILITEGHEMARDLSTLRSSVYCPLIVIAFDIKSADFDNLLIDDSKSVEMALEHLIGLGHTDIGFISDRFTLERLTYFRDTMSSHKLKVNEKHIYVEQDDKRYEACGYAGAAAILDKKNPPTAILAGYDDIAIGAIRLLSERGLRIPEDISVVGIDDINTAPYLPVSLTTVAAPVEEMADIATKILLRKLHDPSYKLVQQVILRPHLIVRESTGPNPRSAG